MDPQFVEKTFKDVVDNWGKKDKESYIMKLIHSLNLECDSKVGTFYDQMLKLLNRSILDKERIILDYFYILFCKMEHFMYFGEPPQNLAYRLKLKQLDKIIECYKLVDLNRNEEALEALDQALALDSDYAEIWIDLTPNFDPAKLNSYFAPCSDSAEIWNLKGEILVRLNRNEEALEALDQALALDPVNTHAQQVKEALIRKY